MVTGQVGEGPAVALPEVSQRRHTAEGGREARASLAALSLQLRSAEREAEAAERRRGDPDPDRRIQHLERSLAAWVEGRRLQYDREVEAAQRAAARRVLAVRRAAGTQPAEPVELVNRPMRKLLRDPHLRGLQPRPVRGSAIRAPLDRPLTTPWTGVPSADTTRQRQPAAPLDSPLPPRPGSAAAAPDPAQPPRPTGAPAGSPPPAVPIAPAPVVAPGAAPTSPPRRPTPSPTASAAPSDEPTASSGPTGALSEPAPEPVRRPGSTERPPALEEPSAADPPHRSWAAPGPDQRVAWGSPRAAALEPDAEGEPEPDRVSTPELAPAGEVAVVVPPAGFGYQLVRLDGAPVPAWSGLAAGPAPYGAPAHHPASPAYHDERRQEPLGVRGFLRRAAHPDVALPLVAALLVLILLLAWLA